MAGEGGQQPSALELFEQIKESPYQFPLFDTLRFIEATYSNSPRLGESVKASDDPVYIRQEPSMAFAPATVCKFIPGYKAQDQLYNWAYGVFGPNGPMPLHITEYAREREIHHNDDTFSRFADIFHHRMISLLYRAWANTQPTIAMDRPGSNVFDQYVGAVAGIFVDEERVGDATLPPKLFRAGLYKQETRSADGLETLLSDYFGISLQVNQYSGGWLAIRKTDRFVLGRHGFANRLGENSCLGEKVYDCQHKFEIESGILSFQQFSRLLPNTDAFRLFYELVTDYIGIAFEWDLKLRLSKPEVPQWSLGQEGQLGWTLWLGDVEKSADTEQECVEVLLHSRSANHYGH